MFALTVVLAFQAPAPPLPAFTEAVVAQKLAIKARQHLERGRRLQAKNKHALAYVHFENAVRANPGSVDARYRMAQSMGHLDAASIALMQLQVLARAPRCPPCRIALRNAVSDPAFTSLRLDPRFVSVTQNTDKVAAVQSCGTPSRADVATVLPAGANEVVYSRVSPDGQWIALVADSGEPINVAPGRSLTTTDIWLMSFDGAIRRKLNRSQRGLYPAFSPDSRSVVFVDNDDVWRIDVDGKKRKRLMRAYRAKGEPEMEYDYEEFETPLVSLDGKWVVAHSTDSGTGHLAAVPFQGGTHRRVSPDETYCFRWQADGLVYGETVNEMTGRWAPKQ